MVRANRFHIYAFNCLGGYMQSKLVTVVIFSGMLSDQSEGVHVLVPTALYSFLK